MVHHILPLITRNDRYTDYRYFVNVSTTLDVDLGLKSEACICYILGQLYFDAFSPELFLPKKRLYGDLLRECDI